MIKVITNGAGATTGSSSAVLAIPNDASGVKANKVMVTVGDLTFILPGSSAATATTSSILISPHAPMIFDVHGITHIAHLEAVAAQRITVVPVE